MRWILPLLLLIGSAWAKPAPDSVLLLNTSTNHIEARGMGGSKEADNIENLQALCRACHTKFGDQKQFKDFLKCKHAEKLIRG